MGSMIRFEGIDDRGPSGTLWNSIVDWAKGTLAVAGGVVDCEDFFPYLGPAATAAGQVGGILLSTDTGSVATASAVPYGVVSFNADAGTYPVAGYARAAYIDFTSIRQVCTEAKVERTAGGTGLELTFVGFSDQAPQAVFHSDGTLDGGSGEDTIGLLWRNDLTVDLVAVLNSAAMVVLIDDVATAVSNSESHKFGLRVKKETSTLYTLFASVDGVVKKVTVASTAIPQVAMRPVVVTTISATDAPAILVDWHCTVDATPS